jgi:hypothetical protein
MRDQRPDIRAASLSALKTKAFQSPAVVARIAQAMNVTIPRPAEDEPKGAGAPPAPIRPRRRVVPLDDAVRRAGLARVAESIWLGDWKTPLAKEVGKSLATVKRWFRATDPQPIPLGVFDRLAKLAAARATALHQASRAAALWAKIEETGEPPAQQDDPFVDGWPA